MFDAETVKQYHQYSLPDNMKLIFPFKSSLCYRTILNNIVDWKARFRIRVYISLKRLDRINFINESSFETRAQKCIQLTYGYIKFQHVKEGREVNSRKK